MTSAARYTRASARIRRTMWSPSCPDSRFFFSSRRRHTRLTCDWSSDVCSSDLDLSFSLPEATSLALLGRNGMGKTTLLNSLLGLTRRFSGAIRLQNRDISSLRPDQRDRKSVVWERVVRWGGAVRRMTRERVGVV